VAIGTMGYKDQILAPDDVRDSLTEPGFLLKIIPHVDASPRICELVRFYQSDVHIKGAWSGPGELALIAHALAPVAELPVYEVVSTIHILTNLTLDLGEVVHDYLA
jgi:acetoacetate decarboxylase